MSRGEEAEAYTKILKAQKQRYGVTIRDIIIVLLGLFVTIAGTLWVANQATTSIAPFIFIVGALYFLMFTVAFFDYVLGFGLFKDNKVVFSAVVVLISVIISTIQAIFSTSIFVNADDAATIGLIYTLLLLVISAFISYFIITATATRQGQEEMIRKLGEIRDEIEQIPISELGSKSAVSRSIKWLQFQQRDDGIWGAENPLYETSEVLRTFNQLPEGVNYSWTRIIDGKEEIRTVEQTYYLVMEALDTANIEPNYEMLNPVLAIAEVNPKFVNLEQEVFLEFKDDISSISEWEFVKSLENFSDASSMSTDIPIIFPMSEIFYHTQDYHVAQQCADIFSSTFDILIRRAQTRFSMQGSERTISNLLLGKMYNALVLMLRGRKAGTSDTVLHEFGLADDLSPSPRKEEFVDGKTGIELPDVPGMGELGGDFDLPDLPEADDDFDLPDVGDDDFSLPSTDFQADSDIAPPKINIDVSMAQIRNFLRTRQSIDGSWGGKIRDTAECLLAVMDQESPESEFIKLAVHYLVALQEKNGSWYNDVALTARITRALTRVNQAMGLGGF